VKEEGKNMINVLIKDGNRTVNWDYSENKTVAEILKDNDFRPVPGSIMINGCLSVENPAAGRLTDCPQIPAPDGKGMRVVITLKSQPEKRPAKKEDANVR
jgi:hypothetical protein